MKTVFADAFFWIASVNPKDSWHKQANKVFDDLQPCLLVTTDEVLTEFLNFYSKAGVLLRRRAVNLAWDTRASSSASVEPQTHDSFLEGLSLYGRRPDKDYSLVDCISMNVMKRLEITEVLTQDKHFSQE